MKRVLRSEQGFALLLTLLIITVLTVAALRFRGTVQASHAAIRSVADGIRGQALARSGIDLGLAILAADALRGPLDTLHDPWAKAKGIIPGIGEGGEQLEVSIEDHSGRIQLNALVPAKQGIRQAYDPKQAELLLRLLSQGRFNLDSSQARQIVAALIDWQDEDDAVTVFEGQAGAESTYYAALSPSYQCANAALASTAALRQIRGITDKLLYGEDGHSGLSPYVTAIRSDSQRLGKININTAPGPVLEALAYPIDQSLVNELIRFRSDNETALHNPAWYKVVRGDLRLEPELVATASVFFEIKATGHIHDLQKTVLCLGERRQGFRIQSWQVD